MIEQTGEVANWQAEMNSPNSLMRLGWTRDSMTIGDVVTVRFNPMKDGSAAGLFIGAKFDADGNVIWSAP